MASLAELKNEEREYREKMRTKNEVVGTPELLSAFQQFDADKSGTLERTWLSFRSRPCSLLT